MLRKREIQRNELRGTIFPSSGVHLHRGYGQTRGSTIVARVAGWNLSRRTGAKIVQGRVYGNHDMLVPSARKNKVLLTDYNYTRDIENRLILATLSTFEVEVLREILNGSLKTTVAQLAEALERDEKDLAGPLDKLGKTKLFEIRGSTLQVCKELRKYFEFQILKFEDDFEPGMEFLQGLLSKVPIHILPTWYCIPRSSDHIFHSIIEKYLLTPRIYERHLSDLHFDDPIVKQIGMDVLNHPELKIRAVDIIEKYRLSHSQFEEYMLHLEYNFVCCLNYQRVDNKYWEEIVIPFAEWREYLNRMKTFRPKEIRDVDSIKRSHPHDFGFVKDLSLLLTEIHKKPLPISKLLNPAKDKEIQKMLPHASAIQEPEAHWKRLVEVAEQMQLACVEGEQLVPTDYAHKWVEIPLQDQAIGIYRHHLASTCSNQGSNALSDRDIREIEKSLRQVTNCGWMLLEDFLKSFIAPIGHTDQVMLRNRGKKWKYSLPNYQESELELVKDAITQKFFEAGIVANGSYSGSPCFCVTPFGRMSLDD